MQKSKEKLILAVDGGGSKTTIVGIEVTGAQTLWPTAVSHCQFQYTLDAPSAAGESVWEAGRRNVVCAVEHICRSASAEISQVQLLYLALSGAGRTTDQARVVDSMRAHSSMSTISQVVATGDIDPIIHFQPDPENHQPTIAAIIGTGSIVATSTRDGQVVRAGGWGPILGDEASGWSLARRALQQLCATLDSDIDLESADPMSRACSKFIASRFTKPISRADRLTLSTEIIGLANDRHAAAKMAPLILDLAYIDNDPETQAFVSDQLTRLVKQIRLVMFRSRLDEAPWNLVLSGGLISNHPGLRRQLLELCHACDVNPQDVLVANPAVAALQMAVRHFRRAN